MAPKGAYVLIPRTCECCLMQQKGLCRCDLETGSVSWMTQMDHAMWGGLQNLEKASKWILPGAHWRNTALPTL